MALLRLRRDTKQISPAESFISKHSACDVSHHKVFTREHQLFKTSAHRFSPPGYPGGIEADFSRKSTLFQTAERR